MWAQLLTEAVAGCGLAVGMALGLARHTSLADPTAAPPVAVRGGSLPRTDSGPAPAPVTGAAWERLWAQAEQVGWHACWPPASCAR
jgi:hypothetical protein